MTYRKSLDVVCSEGPEDDSDTGKYNLFLDCDASRYSEATMFHFAETMDKILSAMRDTKRLVSDILG